MKYYIVIFNAYNESMTAMNFSPHIVKARTKKEAVNALIGSSDANIMDRISSVILVNESHINDDSDEEMRKVCTLLRKYVNEEKAPGNSKNLYQEVFNKNKKTIRKFLVKMPQFYINLQKPFTKNN